MAEYAASSFFLGFEVVFLFVVDRLTTFFFVEWFGAESLKPVCS